MRPSLVRPAFALGALLLATVAACSAGKKKGPGAGVPDDPLADPEVLCEEWGARACNDRVVSTCLAASTDDCVQSQKAFCLQIVPDEYTTETAEACLNVVRNAYEDATLTSTEFGIVVNGGGACSFIEESSSGEGGRCIDDDDCQGDLRCVIRPGDEEGVCLVPDVVGGGFSCSEPNQICDTGFYCDGTNCLARRGAGESCSDVVKCLEGFACEGAPGEEICLVRGQIGNVCVFNSECLSGICFKSSGSGDGLCADEIILSGAAALCQNLR